MIRLFRPLRLNPLREAGEPAKSRNNVSPAPGSGKREYVKRSSVDTPAQGVLNQAIEGKRNANKIVKELRQQIKNEPIGGNRSGLRLKLIRAQDNLQQYRDMEKGALESIEKRANELGQTTKKPSSEGDKKPASKPEPASKAKVAGEKQPGRQKSGELPPGWSGPHKGNRGGTYWLTPSGKKVYKAPKGGGGSKKAEPAGDVDMQISELEHQANLAVFDDDIEKANRLRAEAAQLRNKRKSQSKRPRKSSADEKRSKDERDRKINDLVDNSTTEGLYNNLTDEEKSEWHKKHWPVEEKAKRLAQHRTAAGLIVDREEKKKPTSKYAPKQKVDYDAKSILDGIRDTSLKPIGELRDQFPELSREEFDRAIFELHRQGVLNLHPQEFRDYLSDDEKKALIRDGGNWFGAVSKKPGMPDQDAKKPTPKRAQNQKVDYDANRAEAKTALEALADGLTPETVAAAAKAMKSLRAKDMDQIKKELGIRASGNKSALAEKIVRKAAEQAAQKIADKGLSGDVDPAKPDKPISLEPVDQPSGWDRGKAEPMQGPLYNVSREDESRVFVGDNGQLMVAENPRPQPTPEQQTKIDSVKDDLVAIANDKDSWKSRAQPSVSLGAAYEKVKDRLSPEEFQTAVDQLYREGKIGMTANTQPASKMDDQTRSLSIVANKELRSDINPVSPDKPVSLEPADKGDVSGSHADNVAELYRIAPDLSIPDNRIDDGLKDLDKLPGSELKKIMDKLGLRRPSGSTVKKDRDMIRDHVVDRRNASKKASRIGFPDEPTTPPQQQQHLDTLADLKKQADPDEGQNYDAIENKVNELMGTMSANDAIEISQKFTRSRTRPRSKTEAIRAVRSKVMERESIRRQTRH